MSGTLLSCNVEIVSGSPQAGRVFATLSLEDDNHALVCVLGRGYVYPGHLPTGNGGMVIGSQAHNIRLETRSSQSGIILRVIATILRGKQSPAGWSSDLEGSLDGEGALFSLSGTDPVAGAEVSETVPTNARWALISFRTQNTTSSTTANRSTRLNITDSNMLFRKPTQISQPASRDYNFTWAINTTDAPTEEGSSITGDMVVSIPNYKLKAGAILQTQTVNLVTATPKDQYSAPEYLVMEWLEE